MPLYEFTYTDKFSLSLKDIWELATKHVKEQDEFEQNCGSKPWPKYRLRLDNFNFTEKENRYFFQVIKDKK